MVVFVGGARELVATAEHQIDLSIHIMSAWGLFVHYGGINNHRLSDRYLTYFITTIWKSGCWGADFLNGVDGL